MSVLKVKYKIKFLCLQGIKTIPLDNIYIDKLIFIMQKSVVIYCLTLMNWNKNNVAGFENSNL